MDARIRIEKALESALAATAAPGAPPLLTRAIRHAVFPGGARVRPRLTLAVALACGDDRPELSNAAAAAIEILHCASLVHDDLPCFDDAALRRGKPSVHAACGEPVALLAGDALIILAFETLAAAAERAPDRLAPLTRIIASAVGTPFGITAGQAWECEPKVELSAYHQAKTGALFAGATMAGAAAAGAAAEPWRAVGERLGEAYQVADDIRDVAASVEDIGKPNGQDIALDRPSATRELGLSGAIARLKELVGGAVESVPECPGAHALRDLIVMETKRVLPAGLAQRAA